MPLAPSEGHMWDNAAPQPASEPLDTETAINEKYLRGEGRIVIETNREKLPGFVEALDKPNYIDLRPFYQRRPRWSHKRQSLLIESFIMNVPVPPIFLYERDYNSFEVMDGQQRISAIRDFYKNRFRLKGLTRWPELNGRSYHDLPSKVKAGIDRRSISSIVMLKESAPDDEDAVLLRQLVFERLNTGGVKLERQEIRNALHQGPFNTLLLELSRRSLFRQAWGLPNFETEEAETRNEMLQNSPFFSKMEDTELVLRFFALRHAERYSIGMQPFLDRYTVKASRFSVADIDYLRRLFDVTLDLASRIFGEHLFRPYNADADAWTDRPHKAFYDSVMVGISNFIDQDVAVSARSGQILNGTKRLFQTYPKETFTGHANTKADIEKRIRLFVDMITGVLAA